MLARASKSCSVDSSSCMLMCLSRDDDNVLALAEKKNLIVIAIH